MIQRMQMLLVGWLISALCTSFAIAQPKPPSEEEVKKIQAAVPAVARVQPAKPRMLLVFSRAYGYVHSSIPYGEVAFKAMAMKTKAFTVVCTNDTEMFMPEMLKQFDAVVFNNTNEEIFLPENYKDLTGAEKEAADKKDAELKQSLVNYLKNGGGLAVTHAGVASFRQWPEFGEIIAARFDNHPWVSGTQVTMKVEEPEHPLAAAFKDLPDHRFTIKDETYQVKDPYSRDKVRVLVSIDTEKTNMKLDGVHRTDGDFAITWVKPYGKGRVFYCAIGHDHPLFWNPMILQHYMDGIQFALGDLKADMTPVAKSIK
jgi:type 1 glutamine amidotransferase